MTTTTQVRAYPDTAEILTTYADELGMSRPALLRVLVARYLETVRLELTTPARLGDDEVFRVTAEGRRVLGLSAASEGGEDG